MFKGLGIVCDEEAQSVLGYEELTDDDPDEGKADVDLQGIEDAGDIGGKDDFRQDLQLISAEDADELDLFLICLQKSIQDGKNRYDDGSQQGDQNDGGLIIPEPDDDDGGEGGFRQRIEDDEIGLRHIGNEAIPPEEDGGQCADECP